MFDAALREKGGPLSSCIGFVDGTVRPIARPIANQRMLLNGHKVHCLKFQVIIDAYVQYAYQTFLNLQSVTTPNGLIAHMYGPY